MVIHYDVIVVGGSFAGLNFARCASILGLKVLLIDQNKDIGSSIRTTGILIKDIVEEMNIPRTLLPNTVNKMKVYFPNMKYLEWKTKENIFFMSYTKDFLKYLARSAKEFGAIIETDTQYISGKKTSDVIEVIIKKNSIEEKIRAKFIVGADGAHSKVAKDFKLDKNKKFMTGIEKVYEHAKGVSNDEFYCFVDKELAPGYLCWVTKRGKETFVGLAGHTKEFDIQHALCEFEKKTAVLFDFKRAKLVQTKSGMIPINGPLKKIVCDKALLVGDSAGQIGALTAGGIYPAIKYSKDAANSVMKYLWLQEKNALKLYNKRSFHDSYLRTELILRKAYEMIENNNDFNNIYKTFKTKDGKKLMQIFLFEHGDKQHIILSELTEILKHPKLFKPFGKILIEEFQKII
ncbi:MAG: NAD(P)/FAD-dependent oxidoreductase [Nanoarchaeota archaeon]|nr:NAD(P)/FAD-dependent oxidoreductase [Nanoarchaeota archaeon]MBU1031215.1 NAD(P)/FAD-dependent oxidoreductase [Nanoarchaeota archaeon]MBU1849209.1 NAD(P)/FAD-dependent oxidoreductase [Nanoarchaeota archaeon]